MSLTLLAPARLDAAVPEFARQMVRLPNLEALVAMGKISESDESVERWLCATLGLHVPSEPPIAALRLAAETPAIADTGKSYWLCADPIATTMGMDSVRIDRVVTDLTLSQAEALTRSLTEFFAQDGLHFFAAAAMRWYVRCDAPQQIATTPLWHAIGGSMLEQFPAGVDAPLWRSRLNEAQMLLHTHPVNTEREASGLPPVASVWWWGGGSGPEFGAADIDAVIGGPRWVGAACAANRVEVHAAADPAAHVHSSTRRTLLILDDDWELAARRPDSLKRWDGEWFGPLQSALEQGLLGQATLVFPWGSGTLRVVVESRQRSRWQRWFGFGRPAAAPSLAETLKNHL